MFNNIFPYNMPNPAKHVAEGLFDGNISYPIVKKSFKTIKVKYAHPDTKRLEINPKGDWIDLYADEDAIMLKDDYKKFSLGVAMQIPDGYEAHIVPRSSTFKSFGIIQTNGQAVIDNSYCGDNDYWFYPAYALRDTVIKRGDKICQFRIVEKQPTIVFDEVESLDSPDRGGYGSSGTR